MQNLRIRRFLIPKPQDPEVLSPKTSESGGFSNFHQNDNRLLNKQTMFDKKYVGMVLEHAFIDHLSEKSS